MQRYTRLSLPEKPSSTDHLWLEQHEIQRYSTTFVPDYWFEDPWYLFGVDLFNAKAFWYAHEVWERKWIFLKQNHPQTASHFKILIQTCAMLHKSMEQNLRGVKLHFDKIWPKLQDVQHLEHFYGIQLEDWMQEIWMWKNHQTSIPILTLKNMNESINTL